MYACMYVYDMFFLLSWLINRTIFFLEFSTKHNSFLQKEFQIFSIYKHKQNNGLENFYVYTATSNKNKNLKFKKLIKQILEK